MSETRTSLDAHAFCARPLVRRIYKALVIGVAVFLVTLVAFKQPFRGYLAEARLSGPAIDGLDLDEGARWVRQEDFEVAAVANRPRGKLGRGQLRITHVAAKSAEAVERVNELAERWLYQYLPERLQSNRQRALAELRKASSAAREQEDEARHQVEAARQRQLARIAEAGFGGLGEGFRVQGSEFGEEGTGDRGRGTGGNGQGTGARDELQKLRGELQRLVNERTEEHPSVRTLRSQVASMEKELGIAPGEPLAPSAADKLQAGRPDPHFVLHTTNLAAAARLKEIAAAEAEVSAALTELSNASCERQAAEDRLSERMQELSAQPTSAQWSKSPMLGAWRLGGTPRCSTLTLAALFSIVAGIVTFRAAASEINGKAISSTKELASALELPVVGDVAHLRVAAGRSQWRLLTAGRVQSAVHVAEAVVTIAVAACLLSIAIEPSLAGQVVADPFGAMSEVLGRFGV